MDETPLAEIIRRRIEQLGPMDLGEYMALCLSHPQHGYYMTRDPFGAAGDFTTAPEISQMFGEMIGLWMADMWMKMGKPSEFILLECGPGRGTLMEDIMRATKKVVGFHEAAKLHLMEMSPVLQEAQRQKLDIYDPVWIGDLSNLKQGIPLIAVANEFLDALPVRQLVYEEGWKERVVVTNKDGAFCFGEKGVDFSIVDHLPKDVFEKKENGVFEISPILNHFIKSMNLLLLKQKGVTLFLDYGHTHSAMGNTLQALQSHRFKSIFDTPGLCDLTAHVDFENIKRMAKRDGVVCHGPVTQGDFLRALGIEVMAERLSKGANSVQKKDIDVALNRLIDTEQMGSLFKVLALSYDPETTFEPAGF